MRKFTILFLLVVITRVSVTAQNQKSVMTDVNTPLHALQPDYPVPYGLPKTEDIVAVIDRIYNYLETSSPAKLINSQTKNDVTDLALVDQNTTFFQGVFRPVSYEWGVTYSAMLIASDVTGDEKYSEFTRKRIEQIAALANYYRTKGSSVQRTRNPVGSVTEPRALDDAGSMCAAMIKTYRYTKDESLRPIIDNYINYISTKQFRLKDGTLARNRPLPNTLWLDDLYMSVPALSQMGKLTSDNNYYEDAVKQVIQFSQRMFNKNEKLFMHGWVQDMDTHPEFYWGRCNGWALLTLCELLDVLPENHSLRNNLLQLYRDHVRGLAALQSGTGFWHQLLNRNDSYYETSATAIFTYCIAHGINKKWIDASAFGPMALAGWNAVQTKVNAQGQVEGTCVGTGMAFDPLFYYNRPVNVNAAHGYGPVIMAGAEILRLSKSYQIVINDSAVMFYPLGSDWRSYR
ncbi:MAG: glycoside hydrolase family 88 protein [Bacteroidales bacterium]